MVVNVAALQEADFWSAAWEKSRESYLREKRIRKGKEEIEFWNRLVRSTVSILPSSRRSVYKRCSEFLPGREC